MGTEPSAPNGQEMKWAEADRGSLRTRDKRRNYEARDGGKETKVIQKAILVLRIKAVSEPERIYVRKLDWRSHKLNTCDTSIPESAKTGWKYTRSYSPQRRLRVLVINCRTDSSWASKEKTGFIRRSKMA
ncbi:hypothetical protein TNCV_4935451 [Trichonephila clavipes]|nr:hypothetical protein TNCV_4935451 [Trichonephila clavipes]